MELSDLTVFRAVAREGGVVRAADRVNRVPSAVTARVKRLEDDLGTDLFRREPRGMRLTPTGEVLLSYADRILDLAEDARTAIRGGAPAGPFRLGSMESTAAVRLAGPLTRLAERCPKVDLMLTVEHPADLRAAVRDGRLEAAFLAGEVASDRIEGRAVFREPMVLVSPASAGAEAAGTFLVFRQDCPNRAHLQDWFAREGRRPNRVVEIGSYHAMLGSIAVGLGTAVMPEGMVATFPDRARLSVTPLPDPFRHLDTQLVWRRGAKSPRIDALLEVLAEAGPLPLGRGA